MLNINDILETVQMIQDECLDIRTITMGISLLDCADSDIDRSCQKIYDKIARRGIKMEVLDTVNLVAVTVNPFSAYGFHFSKEELMTRMEAQIGRAHV